jgi:hypothetical protein
MHGDTDPFQAQLSGYIWKVKASPEHFEDKCYNPDRKKPRTISSILKKN